MVRVLRNFDDGQTEWVAKMCNTGRDEVVTRNYRRADIEQLVTSTSTCQEYGTRIAQEFDQGMYFGFVVGLNNGGSSRSSEEEPQRYLVSTKT